jgi:probable addiction module antidote protein
LQAGDPALAQHALGVIARARGMVQLAKNTGLSREGLYRSLSADGNPEFATILKVVKALGLSLQVGQINSQYGVAVTLRITSRIK